MNTQQLYDIVSFNRRNGARVILTNQPASYDKCIELKNKLTACSSITVVIEPHEEDFSDAVSVYEVHVPREAGSICVGCIHETEDGLFSLLLFEEVYSSVFPTIESALVFVRRRGQSYLSNCYLEAVKRIS